MTWIIASLFVLLYFMPFITVAWKTEYPKISLPLDKVFIQAIKYYLFKVLVILEQCKRIDSIKGMNLLVLCAAENSTDGVIINHVTKVCS